MTEQNNLEENQIQLTKLIQQGLILQQQGSYEKARILYEQALMLQPDHFHALQLLGVLFAQIKKYSEAIRFLTKALEINPNHATTHSNIGIALKELNRFDEALTSYDTAIVIKPHYFEAYSNRGNVLQSLKRFDEALLSYDKAIEIRPDYVDAYYNRGNVMLELGKLDAALTSYDKAIEIRPDYVKALCNKGNTLQRLKRLNDARTSYNKAIMIDPEFVDAHWNLSCCNLRLGNFSDGWQGYKWRLKIEGVSAEPLKSNKPSWDFKKTNKRILLSTEQGVGDIIFFSRFLSDIQKDIPNILVQIDKRLVSLLQRSLPQITFYPTGINVSESDYDFHAPIASLGQYFNSSKMNFLKSNNHYLISDKKKTQDIRNILSNENKLLCGISWKSKSASNGPEKSLPLEKMANIFNSKNIRLVNLQYGEAKKDISALSALSDIEMMQYSSIDNLNDLDGLTSLIDACDFIVTVDNVTIQIAAALGKKSFLLLSYFPHFFWPLLEKESSLFPELKIYRQDKINQWDNVLNEVMKDLKPTNN